MVQVDPKTRTGSTNNIQQHRTTLRRIIIAGERNIVHDLPKGQVPSELVRTYMELVIAAMYREVGVLPQKNHQFLEC